MTTVTQTRPVTVAPLWKGAGLTALAALLFPRVNAVIYDHEKIWQLDDEAKVMAPLVVVVTLVLFAAIGLPLWRSSRIATASVVVGVLGLLGVVAYWMSVPIALGGLAVTLGTEALRRDDAGLQRGRARAGVALGAVAMLGGAVLWLLNV